jgi:hypothetical protein
VVPGQALLGEENVYGYRAARLQKDGITWWLALDYGCAILKRRAEWTGQGQAGERTLVSLTPGEPQAALFHVPQSYREFPPSAMFAAQTGAAAAGQRREALARADELYRRHRP